MSHYILGEIDISTSYKKMGQKHTSGSIIKLTDPLMTIASFCDPYSLWCFVNTCKTIHRNRVRLLKQVQYHSPACIILYHLKYGRHTLRHRKIIITILHTSPSIAKFKNILRHHFNMSGYSLSYEEMRPIWESLANPIDNADESIEFYK
jgi:hypothetical protein